MGKIQRRIILFLIIIFFAFISGLALLQISEKSELKTISRTSLEEKDSLLVKLLTLKSASLQSYVYDYSFWDEMISFVRRKDPNWAFINIENVLPTFNVQYVWLLDKNFSLAYSVNSVHDKELKNFPLPKEKLQELLSKKWFNHFFIRSPQGIVEIYTAPLQPGSDLKRSTPPGGYLIAGRVLTSEYLAELSKLVYGNITLITWNDEFTPRSYVDGAYLINKLPLKGWDKKPLSVIVCRSTSELNNRLQQKSNLLIQLSIAFGLIILFSTAFFLLYVIGMPLNNITNSLQTGNPGPISDLAKTQNEFGILASMIIKFFRQKDELSHERDLLHALMKNIPDMIFFKDTSGRYTRVNDAHANILGIEKPELAVGKSDFDFFDEYYALDTYCDEESLLLSKIPIVDKVEKLISSEGAEKWISITKAPIINKENQVSGIVCVARDYTERQHFEDEIKKARDKAEKADKAKSIFLANMSHEIRTPMNAILGFSELLKARMSDLKSHEYLTGIITSGKSLLQMINDILDLSKIEANKIDIKYEPVSLNKICGDIKKIFSLILEEKAIEFEIILDQKLPALIWMDEIRLRQILFNLVGNSVKFTHKGFVKIILESIPGSEREKRIDLRIRVADTGIGIPKEQHEQIFQAFVQQEGQSARKYGGTGLGLNITKRLVNMMNGEISLTSQPGIGSEFQIEFKNIEIASTFLPEEVDEVTFMLEKDLIERDTDLADSPEHFSCEITALSDSDKLHLERALMAHYEEIKEGMMIDEIQQFALEVRQFGTNKNIPSLSEYAKELFDSADTFNVVKIEKFLNKFPGLIKALLNR